MTSEIVLNSLFKLHIGQFTEPAFLQEPFVNIPEDTIREALKVVLGTVICTL